MVQIHDTKGEDWEKLATMYKKLAVDTAARPIDKMLERSNALLPFSQATGIFDNGTGPGPVISRIISLHGNSIPRSCTLSCSDFSQAMIDQVRKTQEAEVAADPMSLWSRVKTDVLNAMDLQGVADESMSHVTAGWVYFMTPDPRKCLSESKRVLKNDGILAVSSWKGSDWLELIKLVARVKPDAQVPSMPEEWMSAAGLENELVMAGFRDVEAHEVPVQMSFDSYSALADLLLTKMPHMVSLLKSFSEEQIADLRRLTISEAEKMTPERPYKLNGVSIVGLGRK